MKFSDRFIELINKWQSGSHDEVTFNSRGLIGVAIEEEIKKIRYVTNKSIDCVYRKISLKEKVLEKLFTEYKVKETYSAWTKEEKIAETIKGGPLGPNASAVSFIFSIFPKKDEIILDLDELYQNKDFISSLENYKRSHSDANIDGIIKYKNTQREVILNVHDIYIHSIYAIGGRGFVKGKRDRITNCLLQIFGGAYTEIYNKKRGTSIEQLVEKNNMKSRWFKDMPHLFSLLLICLCAVPCKWSNNGGIIMPYKVDK